MIKIQKGFTVDIDASTGASVFLYSGTLYDDNSKKVYILDRRSFRKIPNSNKWVYYNIINKTFLQTDDEIPVEELDSTLQLLCPICYIESNSNGIITKLIPLLYDDNFNLPQPPSGDVTDVSAYKDINFITETNIPVNGVNVTTTFDIYHVFDVFIYDHGEVILGTLSYINNIITLQEDISPAMCEVTYGYIVK